MYDIPISKSPTSTKAVGKELARLKAKIPGLYPPEYKNKAICLVGLFNAHSLSYPPAYFNIHTPFKSDDEAGFSVGFIASNCNKASLTLALVSLSVAKDLCSGRASKMDEMMLSDGVGSIDSDSTSIIIFSVLESEGKSSFMSDMKTTVEVFFVAKVLAPVLTEKASLQAIVAAPMMSDRGSLFNMVLEKNN